MMLGILQWAGALAICVGFYFMVPRPRTSAWFTIAGCVLLIVWASFSNPIAWGVVFLQSVVIILSIRNLLKSLYVTSKPQ